VGIKEQDVIAEAKSRVSAELAVEAALSLTGYCYFPSFGTRTDGTDEPRIKAWDIPLNRALRELEQWALAMGARSIALSSFVKRHKASRGRVY
jgi:hypothetical protein